MYARSISVVTWILAAGAISGCSKTTEPLRTEHGGLEHDLGDVEQRIRTLSSLDAPKQREVMDEIVLFFRLEIGPHADWEDERLYPLVDLHASCDVPYTRPLRYEHQILERWVTELEQQADAAHPDVALFVSRAERAVGLLTAHLAVEEEVLFPILDQAMTRDEMDRELLGRHPPLGVRRKGGL